jgi:hypothetical protein
MEGNQPATSGGRAGLKVGMIHGTLGNDQPSLDIDAITISVTPNKPLATFVAPSSAARRNTDGGFRNPG